MQNTVLAHIAAPADAQHVAEWDYDGPNDEIRTRLFRGTRRGENARVDIVGTQAGDGTIVERLVRVEYGGGEVWFDTPQAAREAAADLLAAADELDGLDAIARCAACDADGWLWGAGEDGDPIVCYHERD